MTPEHRITGPDILPESARLAGQLLAIQEAVNTESRRYETTLLEGIRMDLGDEESANDASQIIDTRIDKKIAVVTPYALGIILPLTRQSALTTLRGRQSVENILIGMDDRLAVVAGPCSIHDPVSALEYADRLTGLREQYKDDLDIIMRTYTEKPRTELGWKGFTSDPFLDNSNQLSVGLIATRMLIGRITHMGLPVATEPLNTLTPQYLNGLVAYSGIGARNVTDQTARERASGLSAVVGFKNSTEGSIQAAVEAVITARSPHDFIGTSDRGMTMQVGTKGNETSHVILRGASTGPNYSAEHIAETKALLLKRGLPITIVVDASHGNSQKNHRRQIEVVSDLSRQLSAGETAIRGVMIESHLVEGRQDHSIHNPGELSYGQSITDACVNLETTSQMFDMLAQAVRARRIK